MSQSSGQDVVIRSRLTTVGTEFVVVCGASARVLGGPFPAMTTAVGFAMEQAAGANTRIMYEAQDERGRPVGERLLLRVARS